MALITDSLYKDLIATFVTVLLGVILYLKWLYGYWNRKHVVTPEVSLPFGNASKLLTVQISFGEEFKNIYFDMKAKGLKYCGYYLFTQKLLVTIDLELVKRVLTKDFSYFTDRIEYVNEENDPLTGHLFSLRSQKWRKLRIKLTPTFTSGKMKMMFQSLVECGNQLVEFMDDLCERKEVFDVKEVAGRFTTDIIGTCAFGIECNSLKNPDSEFRKYGKKAFELEFKDIIRQMIAITFPKILDVLKVPALNPGMTKFFLDAVKETVEYREKNNVVRNDFMHLLIQLKNNVKIKDGENNGLFQLEGSENVEGKGLTIEELAAQAFVFFLAGFETSSTTLTFCFYELVKNPEIQEKLREEVKEVLEKHDGKLTYNAIMDMTYMEKCIHETLRKYPPLPVLTRTCVQPYKVPDSDLVIDKDVQVFIPILGIQRDPEYYPDPEKFDPERFSPENKGTRHPYTWLPFGEGPRNCIGLRFGMMQTKVALAVLLSNYRFSLNPKTQDPIVLDTKNFVMSVVGGILLDVEKLNG